MVVYTDDSYMHEYTVRVDPAEHSSALNIAKLSLLVRLVMKIDIHATTVRQIR